MVCTHTMYNAAWAGLISIAPTDLPEALKRKQKKRNGHGRTNANTVKVSAIAMKSPKTA